MMPVDRAAAHDHPGQHADVGLPDDRPGRSAPLAAVAGKTLLLPLVCISALAILTPRTRALLRRCSPVKLVFVDGSGDRPARVIWLWTDARADGRSGGVWLMAPPCTDVSAAPSFRRPLVHGALHLDRQLHVCRGQADSATPYSPDLSPIERGWARRIVNRACATSSRTAEAKRRRCRWCREVSPPPTPAAGFKKRALCALPSKPL